MLPTGPCEPTRLDAFDSAGRALGRATSTAQIDVSPAPAFRDGRMAAVVTHDDGVPSAVVIRVEKPGT